ncbi:MAG: GNAT family N-acetyltransferase [Anaerolineae bacterium]
MSLQIVNLRKDHLERAAELVAQRYQALRKEVPALPKQYGDGAVLQPMLERIIKAGPGVAALEDDRLVGFLAAFEIPAFRGFPAVFSPEWANGAPLDDSARIYRALYTELARQWVKRGRSVHLISTFANDRQALKEWHWLGFGTIVADAVRDLDKLQVPATEEQAVHIRRATVDDLAAVQRLERALVEHLAASPVYLVGHEPETRETWISQLEDPAHAVWLAFRDGEAVAYLMSCPASDDASTIIRDAKTTSITGAFTEPFARGAGIATSLLDRALAWAREAGYARCAVDFETMNPPARLFWLRHFTPVTYSVERHIDRRAIPKASE